MSAVMSKQTHFEVRRYYGRAEVRSVMRATEPHKRAARRAELARYAAITPAVLLIAAAGAVYLSLNPL